MARRTKDPTAKQVRKAQELPARGSSGVRSSWRPQERAAFVVGNLGGVRAAALVFGVAPSQPSRWVQGEAEPGPGAARVLADLDHAFAVALQVWDDEAARDWMTTPNGHLDGARPVDVVRLRGSGEVVDALRAEAAGAFA